MSYCKTLIVLSLVVPICGSVFTEANEGDVIRSISEEFHVKSVLLVTENLVSAEEFHHLIDVQKKLNKMMLFFTSIVTVSTLEENMLMEMASRILIVVHLNEETLKVLTEVSHKLKLSKFLWLCLSSLPEPFLRHFEDVFIPFNTRFFYASFKSDDGQVTLHEVYQITRNTSKRTNYYGTWKSETGLVAAEEEEFFNRRKNLNHISLRYILLEAPDPFNPCKLTWDSDPFVLECLNYMIWHDLAYTFNFTTEYLVSSPVYLNGTRGQSTPILDKIRSGEVDSAMDPLVMTSYRLLHNAYLWPTSYSETLVYTMVPDVEINMSSYLQPFGLDLWLATLAWMICMGGIMTLVKYVVIRVLLGMDFRFLRDCANDSTASLSALCSQSNEIALDDRVVSLRILIIVLNVAPLLLVPAYSGGLITSLANPPSRIPFKDLKELEENGEYKLIAVRWSFSHTHLKTDPRFVGLRKKNLIQDDQLMPVSDNEAFGFVCEKKFSYYVDLLFLKDPPRCPIFTMEEMIGIFYASMAVAKDFPFLELFNRVIQRKYICGIYAKEMEKLVLDELKVELSVRSSKTSLVKKSQFENTKPFAFEDVLPIFAVFCVGAIISVVVFLAERCCARRLKKRNGATAARGLALVCASSSLGEASEIALALDVSRTGVPRS